MTEQWRLLKLGGIDPVESQMIYEVVANARNKNLVPDTVIFCWPKSPIVCIGFHQEVEKEINIDYCQKKSLRIVRRILGGGAVYLDDGQLFYQIIASENNPKIPSRVDKLFEKLLKAPILTYKEIGIPVEYKPINDIQVNGRKISGNGAGKVGDVTILTGNLILDFNFDEMVKILKVPSEKFRDKIASSLKERLTTISQEIGSKSNKENLIQLLKKNFEAVLDITFREGGLIPEEKSNLEELKRKYDSKEWLFQTSQRHPELLEKSRGLNEEVRFVKIADGVYVCEAMFKSSGGLIRITMEVVNKKIKDILISGDFEFFPQAKLVELEKELINIECQEELIENKLRHFYQMHEIQTPGTTSKDFTKTILLAVQNI